MMLTADTAQAMGIRDRGNPEQSIFAGARYLAQVREMIPERIAEPDRTWLTVAAYNVGFGHLEDARIITQALGKNPDSWSEVRERLPLLAQERWYSRAQRGYARGWEPVQFVDRIQRFLTLLEWQPGESGPAPAAAQPPRPQPRRRPPRSPRPPPGTRRQPRRAARRPRSRDARGLKRRQSRRCAKNSLQQPRALLHQHAAEHVDAVIEARQREHVGDAAGTAGARIPGPEHQPAHARVHQGGGAHHARLERHVERRIAEAVAAAQLAGRAQHTHFGVRGRVVAGDRRVAGGGDDRHRPRTSTAPTGTSPFAAAARACSSAARMKAASRPGSPVPVIGGRGGGRRQEQRRIDEIRVQRHAEVQVRPGGAAGRADLADHARRRAPAPRGARRWRSCGSTS